MERSLFDSLFTEAADSEFVRTHTHREGLRTETEAAKVAARTRANVRDRVLNLLMVAGAKGVTYPEAVRATGKRSAQQRLSDLHQEGIAVDSGTTRPHPETGCECAVFVLAGLYEPGAFG